MTKVESIAVEVTVFHKELFNICSLEQALDIAHSRGLKNFFYVISDKEWKEYSLFDGKYREVVNGKGT